MDQFTDKEIKNFTIFFDTLLKVKKRLIREEVMKENKQNLEEENNYNILNDYE